MIINKELSHDAEYLGDVQENRVGIDKSNLDFITTLLTSNLYSKPLESFFRETVANAWDSHVEAGTDEPILLLIQETQYRTYRISIRDYGTGVSPERFDRIYKNIGSSTKRESNDFIGMFGIGRFSCLSCADVAHITSYYNNKRYSYIMYKNGGGINIDLLSVTEGDFKSGLEVSIEKHIFNTDELVNAINKLCLFEKLHVSYKGDNGILRRSVEAFNARVVTHFKTFSKCSLLSYDNYYKVGNILYDCEGARVKTAGIVIDLPIGSVDITPNREALQYTDFTNNSIEARIRDIKQELQSIVDSVASKNMTLVEFCKKFANPRDYPVNIDGKPFYISKEDVKVNLDSTTIDDETLPKGYLEFIEDTRWLYIDKKLIHKTIIKDNNRLTQFLDLFSGNVDIIDKADKTTKQVTLQYIIDNSTKTIVIFTYGGLDALKQDVKDYVLKNIDPSDSPNLDKCIEFTFKHAPIKTMSNDSVPLSYITAFKAARKEKGRKITEKVPVRVYYRYGYRMDYLDNFLTKDSGLVIYSVHTNDNTTLRQLSDIAVYSHGIAGIITLKSDYIKLIEHNKKFITVENFMFLKNPILTKLATVKVIRDNLHNICMKHSLPFSADIPIFKEFIRKYKHQRNALDLCSSETLEGICKYYIDKGWVDKWAIAHFSLTDEEIKGYKGWKKLEAHRYDIVRLMAYKKYGRLPKIGLTPIMIPKSNKYNNESI